MGDRVGLHPLAVLAALFIGMKLFGIFGLIIGPIILAVLMALLNDRKLRKAKLFAATETAGANGEDVSEAQPGPKITIH